MQYFLSVHPQNPFPQSQNTQKPGSTPPTRDSDPTASYSLEEKDSRQVREERPPAKLRVCRNPETRPHKSCDGRDRASRG